MRSEEIVRKAKALIDSNANRRKSTTGEKVEKIEDWNTVVHTENREAKAKIQANKLRMRDLKRRLTVLHKRLDKDRLQRLRGTEPGLEALAEDIEAEEHDTITEHKGNIDMLQEVPEEEEEEENTTLTLFRSHSAEELASLPMFQVTDERLQLLKSWHTSKNWSMLKENRHEKDNEKTSKQIEDGLN